MWKPNVELNFKAPGCEKFHRYFEICPSDCYCHRFDNRAMIRQEEKWHWQRWWWWTRGHPVYSQRPKTLWHNILTLAFICLIYIQPTMRWCVNGCFSASFTICKKKVAARQGYTGAAFASVKTLSLTVQPVIFLIWISVKILSWYKQEMLRLL